MIKIKNIDKYYFKRKSNEIHVLNDINLEFEEKGLITILGPSGSGKSTLLHVIGGLDKAHGQITYDDYVFDKFCNNKMDLYRNKYIGYIFQNYHLIPELTVYQNLKLQLELIGIEDPIEVEKRINICLKVIGMEKYKRRNVTALSGGQQQRIAIARALVKGAKVIIADEPTGNLDSKNSIEVMNILKRLSSKCLILLVSHDKTLAEHYSDRIIRIKDGQIISDDINEKKQESLLSSDDTIYLDEYEKDVLTTSKHQISLYTNTKSEIQLKIIVDNNTIFIQNDANLPIKIIGENNDISVKQTKEVKQEVVSETVEFDFAEKKTFAKKIRGAFSIIKNALLSFFFAQRKTWLVYLSFFFIGALICCCIASVNYSIAYDTSVVRNYPGEAYRVDATKSKTGSMYGHSFEYNELYNIIEDDAGVKGIVDVIDDANFYYKYIGSRRLLFKPEQQCYAATPYLLDLDIDLVSNEIAVSKALASDMIKFYSSFGLSSEQQLLETTFSVSFLGIYNGDVRIKNIYEGDNNTILFSDEIYYMLSSFIPRKTGGTKYTYLDGTRQLENVILRETSTSLTKVYVSEKLRPFLRDVSDGLWEITGTFSSDEYEMVFKNYKDYEKYILDVLSNSAANIMPYETSSIKVSEGKAPTEDFEVIIPDIYKNRYKIGDNYLTKYTVTGYFVSEYPANTTFAFTNSKTAYLKRLRTVVDGIKKEDRTTIDFYVNDSEKMINYFNELGYEVSQIEETVLAQASDNRLDESKVALVVTAIISVVMIGFIFFMSRSKMMQNVYNIGVYRALGAKKSKIISKYLLDSIILATFTAVLGFLLAYAFMCYADNYLPSLHVDAMYVWICVALLYALMIIASLLPISMLLRKTPIDILGKYDI